MSVKDYESDPELSLRIHHSYMCQMQPPVGPLIPRNDSHGNHVVSYVESHLAGLTLLILR